MRSALLGAAVAAASTTLVCPILVPAARAADAAEADEADEASPPRIDPEKEITCLADGDGRLWRVQCTDDEAGGEKRCIYAPNAELDLEGNFARPLSRARPCYNEGPFDQEALRAQGYVLVPGIADAPKGWLRDGRGRVMQVEFDLHRRLWGGVAWIPSVDGGELAGAARLSLDFGLLEWTHLSERGRGGAYRHRLRLATGEVDLAPFGADVVALHYDLSRRYPHPLFRITSFFGRPRRHDIDAHIGVAFDLGHLEIFEVAPDETQTLVRFVTAELTWDLWRSRDLYSFARLRGGLGVERTYVEGAPDRDATTPCVGVDGDLTLDPAGFHHVTFAARYERPLALDDAPAVAGARRGHLEVGYELIVLAVNDQPITLRVGGEADYRGDVPLPDGESPSWEVRAIAGVRLSLWAPAR